MYQEIVKHKEPKILVITPLRETDKISKKTKVSIKRNNTPIFWCSFSSSGNVPQNTEKALMSYLTKYPEITPPKYIIKIDNDIEASRGMLDKMYNKFEELDKKHPDSQVGYVYCDFQYKGAVNQKFPAITFDPNRLMKSNFISSNSMIRLEALLLVGGFVTNPKYERLLDWALWLKMLAGGWIGEPVKGCNFTAYASPESISARNSTDYKIKHMAVIEDFVKPLMGK